MLYRLIYFLTHEVTVSILVFLAMWIYNDFGRHFRLEGGNDFLLLFFLIANWDYFLEWFFFLYDWECFLYNWVYNWVYYIYDCLCPFRRFLPPDHEGFWDYFFLLLDLISYVEPLGELFGISHEEYWGYFYLVFFIGSYDYFLRLFFWDILVPVTTWSVIRNRDRLGFLPMPLVCRFLFDWAFMQLIYFICWQVIGNWEGLLRLFITYRFSLNTGSSILPLICLWPLLSCFLFLIVGFKDDGSGLVFKRVAFITSCLSLSSVSLLSFAFDEQSTGFQFLYSIVDLPVLNLNVVLGLDGLGLVFIYLTALLIPLCILGFWNTVFFSKSLCVCFLVLESLLFFAFLSVDLFFFFVFFESVLIPMFIILVFWGGRSRKIRASYMLFFFTLVGSVIMLLGLLFLYCECHTLDIRALKLIVFEEDFQFLLWWPFFFAFCVKIPVFPFHIWLPEAHVEAPTGGSVLLAGVLLKLGVFGFLRFLIPMFPLASAYFSPIIFVMCSFGLIFGSLIAVRQSDLKRIVAYSSVAHMNLIVMGAFSLTFNGFEGVVLQGLAHGFVSSALFFCIGVLYERFSTRVVARINGLTVLMPLFNMFFLLFTMSSVAVPGTSSFVGELLILLGLLKSSIFVCIIGCTGMVFGGCYSLFLYNRLAYGVPTCNFSYGCALNKLDVSYREAFVLFTLGAGNLSLGLFPFLYSRFIHVCCSEHILCICR